MKVRYYHDELGFNMRMGGLEAVSLTVKLKYLDSWNERRKEIAKAYQKGITNPKIKLQFQPDNTDSVYHLFVITTDDRDGLMKYLNENGINPGLHYPVPCHLQKAYLHLGYKEGDCPHSEYLAAHCVSLPMYAELTNEQVDKVIEVLNKY
jgi:dTDP-4-amino-4,6-dideoxygalactose transaminase